MTFFLIFEETTYFQKIFRFDCCVERGDQVKNGVNPRIIRHGQSATATTNGTSLVEMARAVEVAMTELLKRVRACGSKTEQDFAGLRLLSREQAAELLDLSLSQLDRLTKKGAIPTVWIDRRPRYPLSQLSEWLAARTTNPDAGRRLLSPQTRK